MKQQSSESLLVILAKTISNKHSSYLPSSKATMESSTERVNPGLFTFARQHSSLFHESDSQNYIQMDSNSHFRSFKLIYEKEVETCRRPSFYKITFSIFAAHKL
jgi:hypothetical protein